MYVSSYRTFLLGFKYTFIKLKQFFCGKSKILPKYSFFVNFFLLFQIVDLFYFWVDFASYPVDLSNQLYGRNQIKGFG